MLKEFLYAKENGTTLKYKSKHTQKISSIVNAGN